MARAGGAVRIRIDGTASFVEGWIHATTLTRPPVPTSQGFGMLGLLGGGAGGEPRTLVCPREVPIFVRDGETVKVGMAHANAPIRRLDDETKDEIAIDLGAASPFAGVFGGIGTVGGVGGVCGVELGNAPAEQPTALVPFVRRASLAECIEKGSPKEK